MHPPDGSFQARVARRRLAGFCCVGVLLAIDVCATGVFGGSERTLAVVRTIVLPGLPFLEWSVVLGLGAIAAALAAIGAWLRWGMDWLMLLVMAVCLAVAAFVMPLHHHDAHVHHVVEASHEFTVVLVVFALVARLRLLVARLPGSDWIKARLPQALWFPATDTARAAAVVLITAADPAPARACLDDPRLRERARRVDAWARWRFGGDALRGAHAPLRAALSLAGLLDTAHEQTLRDEARSRPAGVPDSEPTWVRPLDGMLAALALQRLGEVGCVQRWRWIFDTRFALRHGRRPAALHAPSMLSIGAARTWEHAAATALAHRAGWIDAEDWTHLRPRCLGAGAGAHTDPDTLRLVAAGKLWAALVRDSEALAILGRRTIAGDELASALAGLALTEVADRNGRDAARGVSKSGRAARPTGDGRWR